MKLIEKKCPNCGAGLEFDKNDSEVICEYCKKSYIIQRDKHRNDNVSNSGDKNTITDNYSLVRKKKISICVVYVIVIITFLAIFLSYRLLFEKLQKEESVNNNSVVQEKDRYVSVIEEIDEKSLEIFQTETLKKLNSTSDYLKADIEKSEWTYVGMYLLISDDSANLKNEVNFLYVVYKKSYVGDDFNKEIYAAVRFKDLKLSNDNIVINSFTGTTYAPLLFINNYSFYVNGYNDNEELYNKIIRSKTDKYNVISTDGVYMES